MKHIILPTMAAVALNFAASSATAAPERYITTTQTVVFADLNLALKSDQAKLQRRVGSTISLLCTYEDGPTGTSYLDVKCSNEAWKKVRPRIQRAVARAASKSRLDGAATALARP